MDQVTHVGPPELIRGAKKLGIYLPSLYDCAKYRGYTTTQEQIAWAKGYIRRLLEDLEGIETNPKSRGVILGLKPRSHTLYLAAPIKGNH